MQAGVANIPFFGAVAKAFQFFFIQRAGTTDPAVSGNTGQHGHTHAVQERAADPRYPIGPHLPGPSRNFAEFPGWKGLS